jgi:leucine dehydrogenase
MSVFAAMTSLGHEQVIYCRNDEVGLRAIIAIHDTTLGPALGGLRVFPYKSDEEALRDVLRLSRGMTYKAAVAGLELGGGKAVIIGDPSIKTEALLRAFGRHVQSLGGRYITAEDMNTSVDDMNVIRRETKYVTGAGAHVGGHGDPGPFTAWGVYHGIRACLKQQTGNPDVRGRKVAIQGIGSVGWRLAEYLHKNGAQLVFSDMSASRLQKAISEFGGSVVEGDDFFRADVDVLAPCAVGGILNARTIPLIKAGIVAGAANNILEEEVRDGQAIQAKGIAYAPDFAINAGGLIAVDCERMGWPTTKAMDDASKIYDTVLRIFAESAETGDPTIVAANRLAVKRIEQVGRLKHFHVTR